MSNREVYEEWQRLTKIWEARATPKKVKREITLVGEYRYPICNAAFIDGLGETNYCGNCGQRLDWSETDIEG